MVVIMKKLSFFDGSTIAERYTRFNPERGWRTHTYWHVGWALDPQFLLKISSQWGKRWENRYEYWENQCYYFFDTGDDYTPTAFVYIYLDAYHDTPVLPQEALDCIEEFFAFVRKKKFTMLLNFSYCDEATDLRDCATEDIMIAHMKQLEPIVERNRDIVHCLKAGFVGAYGEWAFQEPPVDCKTVTNAIMQYLSKPLDRQYLSRLPRYKNTIGTDSPYYHGIGFSNDAIYGEQTRRGWNSGDFQYGTEEWEQVCREGAFAPNDGEMCTNHQMLTYYNAESDSTGIVPHGIEVIAEAAHHWFNTLSVWHGNHDYNPVWDSLRIMDNWKKEPVTPQMLEEHKVVYDPSWFINEKGETVERSCYEFLRDFVGYRISLISATVTDDGEVTLKLKNHGMSAAFCMTSGFAVLDKRFRILTTVEAGHPETFYSHNPHNWEDTTVLEHTVSAKLPMPQTAGQYHLAFYMKNDLGVFAYMSNRIPTVDGYHILYSFSV